MVKNKGEKGNFLFWESANLHGGYRDKKICFKVYKNWQYLIIFHLNSLAKGVLNKNLNVWLEGSRLANICILPSFRVMQPYSCAAYLPLKVHLQVYKN